jgi:class 3 adenylate cyclase
MLLRRAPRLNESWSQGKLNVTADRHAYSGTARLRGEDREWRAGRAQVAAIVAADIAGYSCLMGSDEAGTLARLKTLRQDLIAPAVAEHMGRIFKTTGDGLLIEFPSVVEAAVCAVEVQREMAARSVTTSAERRIELRIGINIGDIIIDDGDIYGDGVNVAARLEALAEPGGICVSRVVRDQVRDKLDLSFDDTGERRVKNIARPVRVFRIRLGEPTVELPASEAAPLPLPPKPSIAVLPFQNMSGDPAPTAWSRRSSPRSAASAGCLSSLETPCLPTRVRRST